MKKWWKRSKNKIFAVFLSVMCLCVMFPSFDSMAYYQLETFDISFSTIFPKVNGNPDNTIIVPLNYETRFKFSNTLMPDKYYMLYAYTNLTENATFKYVNSSKDYIESHLYFVYGGERFYFTGKDCAVIVQGANTNSFLVGIDSNINLTPYYAGDGYIYENECQLEIIMSGNMNVYEFSVNEITEAKQLQEMISLLTSINGSNSNIATNQAYILEKLHSIMNDSSVIKDKVSKMYELLVQVYGQDEADKLVVDNFQSISSSQGSQLGQLTQDSQVDKIDINSASTTVDSNIDLNAVGSSGVVLSALTGNQKVLTMLLGVTAISLIAYVFFGKR